MHNKNSRKASFIPRILFLLAAAIVVTACPSPLEAPSPDPTDTQPDVPLQPVPTHTVTYDGNGATAGQPPIDATEYKPDETVVIAGPGTLVRDGYDFAGWNTAADGSGTHYASGATVSNLQDDLVLYAVWDEYSTYRVFYVGVRHDSGSPPVDPNTYREGDTVTVLDQGTLQRNEHVFAGWSKSQAITYNDYEPGQTFVMGTSDVTLASHWEYDPSMTVTYSAEGTTGGTAPVDPNTYRRSAPPVAMGPGSLERIGHVFDSWSTDPRGNFERYEPGDPIDPVIGELILYPQWTPVEPAFTTRWDNGEIELPLIETGTYDFFVSVGGFPVGRVTSHDDPDRIFKVSSSSQLVEIWGQIEGLRVSEGSGTLLEISQWGPFAFGEGSRAFAGASQLQITATDAPDLTGTTSFYEIFRHCRSITDIPGIGDWDVSNVTTMRSAFSSAESFNADLSGWDTSAVTDTSFMFSFAKAFNQPIGSWDTSSVTDMTGMFQYAESFNHDLPWDTSAVVSLSNAFWHASAFNGDVSNWDTSNVLYIDYLFAGASNFNQPVGHFDVSNVEIFDLMFSGSSLDQDLSGWDISSAQSFQWFLEHTILSTENYDKLLIGWAAQESAPSSVVFDAAPSKYSEAAVAARDYLTGTLNWTITDGGPE